MPTIAQALTQAALKLECCSDSPSLDAQLLLAKLLRRPRAALIADGAEMLPLEFESEYSSLIARRLQSEPVAYLTGTREFWSLPLAVSPAVLVPRPETETLVELALTRLAPNCDCTVLDLGTGSGAIALAIAHERPQARVTGTDLSAEALAVARANAIALGLTGIAWRQGSWFDAVPGERFDLIVANPPYVAAGDPHLVALTAEPRGALTPGPSGLEALQCIIANGAAHLNRGGTLALEHGCSQARAVVELLERHGFTDARSHCDRAGLPRVTLGVMIHE